jgi:hypothetical protein
MVRPNPGNALRLDAPLTITLSQLSIRHAGHPAFDDQFL